MGKNGVTEIGKRLTCDDSQGITETGNRTGPVTGVVHGHAMPRYRANRTRRSFPAVLGGMN
jgi:hypothetical protein